MKILILQHSAGDPPAAAGAVLTELGHELEVVRVDKPNPIPNRVVTDAIISFGGAMSLASDRTGDRVKQEQDLLALYFQHDKHVLGICLGAQMLAMATGADVTKNPMPEVGWHMVRRTDEAHDCPALTGLPDQFYALQWHQDTFAIPAGASHAFQSEACQNQAYALNTRAIGLQFHLEADERLVRLFLAASDLPKKEGRFIQTDDEIRTGIDHHLANQNQILRQFLETWTAT